MSWSQFLRNDESFMIFFRLTSESMTSWLNHLFGELRQKAVLIIKWFQRSGTIRGKSVSHVPKRWKQNPHEEVRNGWARHVHWWACSVGVGDGRGGEGRGKKFFWEVAAGRGWVLGITDLLYPLVLKQECKIKICYSLHLANEKKRRRLSFLPNLSWFLNFCHAVYP